MYLKKLFSIVCITLFIIIISSHSVFCQQKKTVQKYDIVVAGFRIGGMVAEKTETTNQTKFEINSLVEFWFFGKVHVEFLQTASYLDDQLIEAYTHSISNRGDFETFVKWSVDHYDVKANTYKYENKKPISKKVYSSPAKFYFEEPKEGDVLISENFGLLTTVKEDKPGIYSIDVNGNRNTFYYEEGILQKVVLENSLKNYVIRRADD